MENIRRAGVVGRDVNNFSGRDFNGQNRNNFVKFPVTVSSDAPETELRTVFAFYEVFEFLFVQNFGVLEKFSR